MTVVCICLGCERGAAVEVESHKECFVVPLQFDLGCWNVSVLDELVALMSKYTLPTSEFGKLNLGEELKESRPVMPKTTRSGVQKQKATSSSRVPTKTAAGPSKTTSKSLASRTTRTASTQKRRPASGKARLEPEEEDDEEEDEDSDDSDDDDGDDDDDNDNNQSNAETDDARRRRTITELLSILTDTFMTPQEFDLPNASTPPIMRTNRT